MADLDFCLLTACRNEAGLIDQTIRSVVAQSLRPRKWLILDDGSTDQTAELARQASLLHPWICLHQFEPRAERSFGAQYRAIMRGYEMIRDLPFNFIGV